jgi:uncharacterized membrane protein YoaK (UPF0700 family)
MCIVGGYFGGYAVLSCAGRLGSAQTLNMIEIVCDILGRDYRQFLLRVLCAALYVSALIIALIMMKKTTFHVQRYGILVEIAGIVVLRLIPVDAAFTFRSMPILFMMATQWMIFHGNSKYNSATVFSTNNLKQLSLSLAEYVMDRDVSHLDKAKYFGNSLLWYHVGVAAAFFACRDFFAYASLFALPYVFIAMGITYIPEKKS